MPCNPIVVDGVVTGIVCSRGPRKKPCAFCGQPSAGFLCDGKWVAEGVKTSCDKAMCTAHRTQVGGGKDYCPDCVARTKGTKPKTVSEMERDACRQIALDVKSEAQTEHGKRAAQAIADRIELRSGGTR